MVKKLETGTTVACTKSLQMKVKTVRKSKRKEQNKKIKTSTMSLDHASIQGNNHTTLPCNKIKKLKRKCYGCGKKGHKIESCPFMKENGLMLEKGRSTNHLVIKVQDKVKSFKDRLCYICRRKGHLCKDCPISNYNVPSLSIDSYVTRQPKISTCARKVMSLPSASTKDIWVSRSLLTNLDGPIKRWVPKYA
jgi:hypothetical protein